ncbi:MAG TPA: hypothetical protein VMF62_09550 [Acetobacteraceae bacterium]|nr:hypothetical protein [Acetobacteraceae bacterium]
MRRPRGSGDNGFALIAVLWAATILGSIAIGVAAISNAEIGFARSSEEVAQLNATADAAISLVIQKLADPLPSAHPPIDGTPFMVRFAGYRARVNVQDESGKIDLNMAPREYVYQLFVTAGVDLALADALSDRILDWREPGLGKRLNGAKRADYLAAGYPYGPREGPFHSVAEMKLVMGMTQDIFDRVSPSLTVFSQVATVDADLAPRSVLVALAGMNDTRIDQILDARMASDPGSQADEAQDLAPPNLIGHAFTISAEVGGKHGGRVVRTAVVRLTGQFRSPFWVYQWN